MRWWWLVGGEWWDHAVCNGRVDSIVGSGTTRRHQAVRHIKPTELAELECCVGSTAD
jgi:hypothetical protein